MLNPGALGTAQIRLKLGSYEKLWKDHATETEAEAVTFWDHEAEVEPLPFLNREAEAEAQVLGSYYKGPCFTILPLFSKRNATFLKLHFFWSGVYTSESGVMHHFDSAHDPRVHDPDPGPQEKSTEKSCVSFGKNCTTMNLRYIWVHLFENLPVKHVSIGVPPGLWCISVSFY